MSDPFGVDESSSGRRRLRRRKASRSSRWIQREEREALQARDPQNLPPLRTQRDPQEEAVQPAVEIPAPEPAEVPADTPAVVASKGKRVRQRKSGAGPSGRSRRSRRRQRNKPFSLDQLSYLLIEQWQGMAVGFGLGALVSAVLSAILLR